MLARHRQEGRRHQRPVAGGHDGTGAILAALEAAAPPRPGHPFGQGRRLHRRRGHQRVPAHQLRGGGLRAVAARAAGSSPVSRQLPCPSVAVYQWQRPRRRPGAGARGDVAPGSAGRAALPRPARKCSSACTPDSAAPCGLSGCSACGAAMELMLTGRSMTMTDAARCGLVDRISSPRRLAARRRRTAVPPQAGARPTAHGRRAVAARSAGHGRRFPARARRARKADPITTRPRTP